MSNTNDFEDADFGEDDAAAETGLQSPEEQDGTEGQSDADISAEQSGDEDTDATRKEPTARTGEEGEGGKAKRVNREQQRLQVLANRNRESEERAVKAEQRLAALEQRLTGQTAEVQERERQQRRALMTPEEQLRDDLEEAGKKHDREIQNIRTTLWEQQDKATFDTFLATSNGRYAKLLPEVNQAVAQLRQVGNYSMPRLMVLDWALGKTIREKGMTARPKEQEKGAKRIASQTVRPSSTRSDERGSDSRTLSERAAREKRLSNMQI